jgi:hypothetical protein
MMMKRVLRAVLVLSVLAAGVACSDSTEPSETKVFTATLLPANENPPVTNAQNTGSGTVVVQVAVTRDSSNAITAATYYFSVDLKGFPAGTRFTASHIHRGIATVNGPVIVDTALANGEIIIGESGAASYFKQTSLPAPGIATEILANPAGYYFNIHSTLSPGGVARGQLTQQ